MTRKCHGHRPQTNSRHLEEETQNTDRHATAGTHFSKVTRCLARQDDFEKQVSMTKKCHNHRPPHRTSSKRRRIQTVTRQQVMPQSQTTDLLVRHRIQTVTRQQEHN